MGGHEAAIGKSYQMAGDGGARGGADIHGLTRDGYIPQAEETSTICMDTSELS